jgi:hypothetical protein
MPPGVRVLSGREPEGVAEATHAIGRAVPR